MVIDKRKVLDMITFKKRKSGLTYTVFRETFTADAMPIGVVRKVERWTVRGTRIEWEAYRKGNCVGTSFATRKEAAEYLEKTQ